MIICATLTALALGGCGGSDTQASVNRIAELCTTTTNIGETLCRCVGDRAASDLTAPAREFLAASLEQKDESQLAELRGKLTLEEMMQAGMFMTKAPAACAQAAGTSLSKEPS